MVIVYNVDTTFSTLFKAPVTTTIFTLRMIDMKIVCCATLVPYVVTSLITSKFTTKVKIAPRAFRMISVPGLAVRANLGVDTVTIKYTIVDVMFYVILGKITKTCKE